MTTAQIDQAIRSRMSTRAFSDRPVTRESVVQLLNAAAVAGSGETPLICTAHVLTGASRDSLCDQVCAAHDALRVDPSLASRYAEQYDYYPAKWSSPYIDRRRENGWGLYGLLGIGKADKDKMHAQHQRNYRFFDAPVGLMFTVEAARGSASLVQSGRLLQSIMLLARAHGLHTCPQAAWNSFASMVLAHVGAQPGSMLVCGMAMGYADEQALVNTYYTPRIPADAFTHWLE